MLRLASVSWNSLDVLQRKLKDCMFWMAWMLLLLLLSAAAELLMLLKLHC
jgi:hypothetical protein